MRPGILRRVAVPSCTSKFLTSFTTTSIKSAKYFKYSPFVQIQPKYLKYYSTSASTGSSKRQVINLKTGGPTLFTRTVIPKYTKEKISDSSTLYQLLTGEMLEQDESVMPEKERTDYTLTRRKWADLIRKAPSGSVAEALQVIGEPLYELVGEIGGKGMGKTFDDNRAEFYAPMSAANAAAWAKYETKTIWNAAYTTWLTKAVGLTLLEEGRAWIIWLCHCVQSGKKDRAYVLSMSEYYPWDDLSDLTKAGIAAIGLLKPEIWKITPPFHTQPARGLDEL